MKTITFRADEELIKAARTRARAERTTLNEQFRLWLESYAHLQTRMDQYDAAMQEIRGTVRIGYKLNRDAMNDR